MLRLLYVFFRQSLLRETAFRMNFIVSLVYMVLSLGGAVGGIAILFSNTADLGGWNAGSALIVVGVYYLMESLRGLFIGPSLGALAGLDGELWVGTFDFALLKPIPTLLHVSIRRWSPTRLVHLVVSIVILVIGCRRSGTAISPDYWLGFLLMLVVGFVILYSILLLLTSAAFRYLGTPLLWIFDSIIQTARYPMAIYPKGLSILLTWVIPVGFIVTVPAETLLSGLKGFQVLGGVAIATILLTSAVLFFRKNIRMYTSASS